MGDACVGLGDGNTKTVFSTYRTSPTIHAPVSHELRTQGQEHENKTSPRHGSATHINISLSRVPTTATHDDTPRKVPPRPWCGLWRDAGCRLGPVPSRTGSWVCRKQGIMRIQPWQWAKVATEVARIAITLRQGNAIKDNAGIARTIEHWSTSGSETKVRGRYHHQKKNNSSKQVTQSNNNNNNITNNSKPAPLLWMLFGGEQQHQKLQQWKRSEYCSSAMEGWQCSWPTHEKG